MDLDTAGKFISNVGFPIALVLMLLWVVWRAGNFLAPLITAAASSHISLVDTLKDNDTTQTNIMATQSKTLLEHTHILNEIHTAVKTRP